MLTPFRELLDERRAAGAAAGAFTCYDVTTALAVVQAAEARNVPVVVLVAEASFRAPSGRLLLQRSSPSPTPPAFLLACSSIMSPTTHSSTQHSPVGSER